MIIGLAWVSFSLLYQLNKSLKLLDTKVGLQARLNALKVRPIHHIKLHKCGYLIYHLFNLVLIPTGLLVLLCLTLPNTIFIVIGLINLGIPLVSKAYPRFYHIVRDMHYTSYGWGHQYPQPPINLRDLMNNLSLFINNLMNYVRKSHLSISQKNDLLSELLEIHLIKTNQHSATTKVLTNLHKVLIDKPMTQEILPNLNDSDLFDYYAYLSYISPKYLSQFFNLYDFSDSKITKKARQTLIIKLGSLLIILITLVYVALYNL